MNQTEREEQVMKGSEADPDDLGVLAALTSASGDSVPLPPALAQVLVEATAILAQGRQVRVVAEDRPRDYVKGQSTPERAAVVDRDQRAEAFEIMARLTDKYDLYNPLKQQR